MKLPSCSVCLNTYNEEDRVPMMLTCGHSFCKECLAHLFEASTDHTIICPRCRLGSKVGNSVEALRKNYGMISLIRQASSECLTGDDSESDDERSDIVSNAFSDRSRGNTPQASPGWPPACTGLNLDLAAHSLRFLRQIGTGPRPGQDVWTAMLTGPGGCRHKVAVKRVDMVEGLDLAWVQAKMEGLRRAAMWCQNVCAMYGVIVKDRKLCIVMDKYAGSMLEAMQQNGGRLTLEQILRYGADIARGVSELHAAGIMCLGLKPSNILLDKRGRAVVADYGLPEVLKRPRCRKAQQLGLEEFNPNAHSCRECIGLAPSYMAPEAWEPLKKSSLNFFWEDAMGLCLESDAWSFGCTLVEMCTGVAPWAGASAEEIRRAVVKAKRQPPQYAGVVGGGIPRELWKVIGECLQWKPVKRPAFHAMLSIFLRHLKEIPLSPPPSPDNDPAKDQTLRSTEPSPPSILDFAASSDTALHHLISEADVNGVRDLLASAAAWSANADKPLMAPPNVGALMEARNEDGQTPLHLAAMRGYAEIMELLLSHLEADPEALDKNGDTPIFFAVASGSVECLRALVRRGANVEARLREGLGPAVAHVCASHGQTDCMKELLAAGASAHAVDDDGETLLHRALAKQHTDCALAILRHGGCGAMSAPSAKGLTPLHLSTASGNVEVVRCWLELASREQAKAALEVASPAGTALCMAASLNKAQQKEARELVRLLLGAGADATAREPSRGYTCLHWAAVANDDEMVKTILDAGVDVDLRDAHSNTPLHVALARGSNLSVGTLLERGADFSLQDDDGDTALHIAASLATNIGENLKWLLVMLLRSDADPLAKNHNGKSLKDLLDVLPREWLSEELLMMLSNKGLELTHAMCSSGDWVVFKQSVREPKYGWQGAQPGSVGFVQTAGEGGELTVMFCSGEVRALAAEVHKQVPFEQGQHVRVKAAVSEPRYGWRGQSHGSVGTVLCVDDDGVLRVGFQGASRGWKADPADMERVERFKVGDWVCVRPGLTMAKHGLGSVTPGSIGVVYSLRADHGLLVEFNYLDGPWHCEPEELEPVQPFKVGDRICVKRSVPEPRRGWDRETHHSVGTVTEVGSDALLMVSISGRPVPWQVDPADMDRLEPLAVGDWVRVKASVPSPKYGWEDVTRSSIGVVHMLDDEGDVGIGFGFRSRPFDCSLADVEKVTAFQIGQVIHISPHVVEPRLGWSGETAASSGKITSIDMDGTLNVRVPNRSAPWRVTPGDAELLSGFEVGGWVRLRSGLGMKPSIEWLGAGAGGRGGTNKGCGGGGLPVDRVARRSIAVVHSVSDSGNLELAGCFRAGRWTCHFSQVEKVPALKIGQHVQIKKEIITPRWGWRGLRAGSRGVVVGVHADGEVQVAFAGLPGTPWRADPADLEQIDMMEVGDWVRIRPGLREPRLGWQGARPGSVGVVQGWLYQVDPTPVPAPEATAGRQVAAPREANVGYADLAATHSETHARARSGHASEGAESMEPGRGRGNGSETCSDEGPTSGCLPGSAPGRPAESVAGARLVDPPEDGSAAAPGLDPASAAQGASAVRAPSDAAERMGPSEGSGGDAATGEGFIGGATARHPASSPGREGPVEGGPEAPAAALEAGEGPEPHRGQPPGEACAQPAGKGAAEPSGQSGGGSGGGGASAECGARERGPEKGDVQWAVLVGFCGQQERWAGLPEELQRVEPIRAGQAVRVKAGVRQPRFGWAGQDGGTVGTVASVDADGRLRVHSPVSCQKAWMLDPAEVEVVEDQPLQIGDWVRVRPSVPVPAHQWGEVTHGSVGVVHRIDDEGDLWVAFCFLDRLWMCRPSEMERVEPFRIGQDVRVKRSVANPRLGWGNETGASRGVIALIDADGKVRVRFRRREGRLWVGDPADLELEADHCDPQKEPGRTSPESPGVNS